MLSSDYIVQDLWQSLLFQQSSNQANKYFRYSLQYFKYHLNLDLVQNPNFLKQKITEYERKFSQGLDDAYTSFPVLQNITIPHEVHYCEQHKAIFIYFLIPQDFSDIFSSEEEWSFSYTEVPANINLNEVVRNSIEGIIENP